MKAAIRRLVSYYRATAVVVLGTLLLLVSANLVAWMTFRVRSSYHKNPLYGRYGEATVRAGYPGLTASGER